jgi:hypothetical protein
MVLEFSLEFTSNIDGPSGRAVKARFAVALLAGIAGSSSPRGMKVCLL